MTDWAHRLYWKQFGPQARPAPKVDELLEQADLRRQVAADDFESGFLQPGQREKQRERLEKGLDAAVELHGIRLIFEEGTAAAAGEDSSAKRFSDVVAARDLLGLVNQALSNPSLLFRAQADARSLNLEAPPTGGHAAIGALPPQEQATLMGALAQVAAETRDWHAFAYLTEATRKLHSWSAISRFYGGSAPTWIPGGKAPKVLPPTLAQDTLPILTAAISDATSRRLSFLERLTPLLVAAKGEEGASGIAGFKEVLASELGTLLSSPDPEGQLTAAGVLAGLHLQIDDWLVSSVGHDLLAQAQVGTTADERLSILEEIARASNAGLPRVQRAREAYRAGDLAKASEELRGLEDDLRDLLTRPAPFGSMAWVGYNALIQHVGSTRELLPDPTSGR